MDGRPGRADAVVAVLRDGDSILVIKRGPKAIMSGYWCPPSGRLEPGETQAEALVREVYEELGLNATPVAKVYECPTHDDHFLLHWWTAELDSDELRVDGDEVAEARWVTPAEFLELAPTFEGDRDFFTRVLPTL